jgi:hypothetical protein
MTDTNHLDHITKLAHAAGGIKGLSLNLLGGQDSLMHVISPKGIMGDVEKFVRDGRTDLALKALSQARLMIEEIQTYAKSIV